MASTGVTAIPDFCSKAAVPPVESNCTPRATSAWANSRMPFLFETLSSARRIAIRFGRGEEAVGATVDTVNS